MTTYRQIKVTGDWLDNAEGTPDAYDPEVFTAFVAVDDSGHYQRWNGWVASPLFTFPEAQRLAAWLDAAIAESGADASGFDRIVVEEDAEGWQSVTHVPNDPDAYGPYEEGEERYDGHINPYVGGLVEGEIVYDLGLGWTWVEHTAS